MARGLLWFGQIVLALFMGAVITSAIAQILMPGCLGAINPVFLMPALLACLVAVLALNKKLTKQLSYEPIAILSEKRKISLLARHSNLIGVLVLVFLVGFVGVIILGLSKNEVPKEDAFFGMLFVAFLVCQSVLFFAGFILSVLLDRYQLYANVAANKTDARTGIKPRKVLLIVLAVPAFLLYIPFIPLYVLPTLSKGTFELLAKPEERLNREFAHELSILTDTGYDYNKNIIYDFVGRGADINTVGEKGTPICFAVRAGDVEFLKDMISKGANLNLCGPDGTTALMFAAVRESPDCMDILLEAHANLTSKNVEGDTVLTYAARSNDPGRVEQLRKLGAK